MGISLSYNNKPGGKNFVIVPFFVKVVQTAVAHAWDFAEHLVTA